MELAPGVAKLISWIALGLVVGLAAKWIASWRQPPAIVMTILLGIGGALVGGYLGSQLGLGTVRGFDLRSLALALGGALLLLFAYRTIQSRA
jgi:uncharacterized membrane protein YeaQ/YmgE (transglycosylase-associated protein family)